MKTETWVIQRKLVMGGWEELAAYSTIDLARKFWPEWLQMSRRNIRCIKRTEELLPVGEMDK